jgi:hypothetical protein
MERRNRATGAQQRRSLGAKPFPVSGEFFSTLGVSPLRGRLFRPEDEALACPNLQSVVSYAFWQTEMGGRELGPESKLYANGKAL